MDLSVTRRDALIGAGAFIGCFALGGAGVAFASEEAQVRPPGGQDESRLRSLCLKCDRCRSVCPQGIVVSTMDGIDVFDARLPKLDFHLGYCDYCGLCQDVCPTQALSPDFDEQTDVLGIVQLDSSACLAFSATCEKCKDSCPYGALVFDASGHPVIEESLCNGCGRCVNACQSNIASSYSGVDRALEVHAVEVS